jgi:hypothetical protein
MPRGYQLPFREWRRLSRRAKAAQKRGCFEVRGLLGTSRDLQIGLFFVANESSRPGHFEFSWKARETVAADRDSARHSTKQALQGGVQHAIGAQGGLKAALQPGFAR